MTLLRVDQPRATAELGYRVLAGVVVGGLVELLGVAWARTSNPQAPNYLVPSVVAVAVGVAVAVIDPPAEQLALIDEEVGQVPMMRQGDAWLAPDGTQKRVTYSHAQTAMDITGAMSPGFEPTEDELRCCGLSDEDWQTEDGVEVVPMPWCIAEARLTNGGWQRIKGAYSDLGFEIFSEPTRAQRNMLRRISMGANRDRALYIDVSDNCGGDDGSTLATFTAPPGMGGPRHQAIDDAIEKVTYAGYDEA
jgi:hypothetical protein